MEGRFQFLFLCACASVATSINSERGRYYHLTANDGKKNLMTQARPSDWFESSKGILSIGIAVPKSYFPADVANFLAFAVFTNGGVISKEYFFSEDVNITTRDDNTSLLEGFQPAEFKFLMPKIQSQFWTDAINGIFSYELLLQWNGIPSTTTPPVRFTIQGFQTGVELNVTGKLHNDPPKPKESPGFLARLHYYEEFEIMFLNNQDEYVQIVLGPWGHHSTIFFKGYRGNLQSVVPLDNVVEQAATVEGDLMWSGSAFIPVSYFPPNVNQMNSFAKHGLGVDRVYNVLYPAPFSNTEYASPDFHRLELFESLDATSLFEDNSQYSDLWQNAVDNLTMHVSPPPSQEDVTEHASSGTDVDTATEMESTDGLEFTEPVTATDTELLFTTEISFSINDAADKLEKAPRIIEEQNKHQSLESQIINKIAEDQITVPKIQDESLSETKEKFEVDETSTQMNQPVEDPAVFSSDTSSIAENHDEAQDIDNVLSVSSGGVDSIADEPSNAFEEQPQFLAPHHICFREGLIPDIKRCQIFYECVIEDNQWKSYTWRCPRGKVYDPIEVSCIRGICTRSLHLKALKATELLYRSLP